MKCKESVFEKVNYPCAEEDLSPKECKNQPKVWRKTDEQLISYPLSKKR